MHKIYNKAITVSIVLPCYRMTESGTCSKRSGAATKGLESCEFWFQVAFFNLNTALYFLGGMYVCMEENNLKISLALYIRLEFSLAIPLNSCRHDLTSIDKTIPVS